MIDYKNLLITELPNGDWAQTILRQFLFSTYQYYFYQQLENQPDQQLAAIAEKSLKEVTYHVRWSSEWVIRLGDGTEESHKRLSNAVTELWNYTGELFIPASYEKELVATGIAVDLSVIQPLWQQKVSDIFHRSNHCHTRKKFCAPGGKRRHTH